MQITSRSRIAQCLVGLGVFLIIAGLITGMAGCDYTLRPSKNLEIRTWYDLDDVRDNLEGHHILMNDLDSSTLGYEALASPTANGGKGWKPIGWQPIGGGYSFEGSFDGQGYEIHDLHINRAYETANSYETVMIGLFGAVREGGRIENVGVVDATVNGIACVGGLVGFNSGNVSDCYFTGSVGGQMRVGGLLGYSDGDASECYFIGTVTGETLVGALVGDRVPTGTISNSHYDYDEVFINGENIITTGALFDEDFDQWLANYKFLDINDRLSQEDGYYLVNNVTDFKELLALGQNSSLKFRLADDLDLGGDPNFYVPYLAGEFDGNGHRISNLSFNFDFVSYVGVFGQLASGGKLTRVGVENLDVTGNKFVGGLAGVSEGTVSNCYATGNVAGRATRPELSGYEEDVGGLVGLNRGTVSNSCFTGSVTGLDDVGGLVGRSGVTVSDSYFTGSVTGTSHVGGLVGDNGGTVSNSHSAGTVTGAESVGGLVGSQLSGTVSNCHFTGNVGGYYTGWGDLAGWAIGGLVGSNHDSTVSGSYSTGNVTGRIYVGGLVGWNHVYATVYNSYCTGSVTGDVNVGGLVGQNDNDANNCYSTGSVTGNENVGGLIGLNREGAVNNSFWDIETSGQTTSAGGTGKTTAEMKDIITFSGVGWNIVAVALNETNFSYIWNIVNNVTYPFLSWQA